MKFKVTIVEDPQKEQVHNSSNWFGALQAAAEAWNIDLRMQDLRLTMLEDGRSAKVQQTGSNKTFEIISLNSALEESIELEFAEPSGLASWVKNLGLYTRHRLASKPDRFRGIRLCGSSRNDSSPGRL